MKFDNYKTLISKNKRKICRELCHDVIDSCCHELINSYHKMQV